MKSTKIRISTDFVVSVGRASGNSKINKNTYFCRFQRSPFQKRNCPYKNFNFQNLRDPPPHARWSISDVDRDGVHVVCMWYAVGVYRVHTVYVKCMRVVCTWYAFGMHAARTWHARGVDVVCTQCTRGMHVACTRYARDIHVVYT